MDELENLHMDRTNICLYPSRILLLKNSAFNDT